MEGHRKLGDIQIRSTTLRDPDYQFLKKGPEHRKLHAWIRMQQILLEEQQYFPELSGNSPGRPASSDNSFSHFQAPLTPMKRREPSDGTASLQSGTETAAVILQSDHFFVMLVQQNNKCNTCVMEIVFCLAAILE
jgi:hypothetical protein